MSARVGFDIICAQRCFTWAFVDQSFANWQRETIYGGRCQTQLCASLQGRTLSYAYTAHLRQECCGPRVWRPSNSRSRLSARKIADRPPWTRTVIQSSKRAPRAKGRQLVEQLTRRTAVSPEIDVTEVNQIKINHNICAYMPFSVGIGRVFGELNLENLKCHEFIAYFLCVCVYSCEEK